ncbi:ABC transporter permease [bacterium]|nr:ABC transporter permease [bacterium]
MRKILKFAKREYKATVRTKGFIIGIIVAPILMSGSLVFFFLLKDRVDTTDKRVAIIDRSGIVAEAIIEAAGNHNEQEVYDEKSEKKVKPEYIFEVIEPDTVELSAQRLELSNKVRNGIYHAFVEIGSNVLHPGENVEDASIDYYGKNAAMDEVRRWMSWPVNNFLRRERLADAGIDESEVKDLFNWVTIQGLGLVTVDEATGDIQDARKASEIEAMLIPIFFMMLLFMMMMMSVPGMLQSVMEEKTQRIAEVLLGSLKPFEFMMGKLVGGIAVSLTISAVYIIGGTLVVHYMGYQDYIPFEVIPWFFVYMLLAIIMYGSMALALGASCSEPKDAQSLTFMTIIPAMIPMFVYFPIAREPMGSFATVFSLIPFFTPTLMLLRLATPDVVPIWQPIVGTIGVIIFTIIFVWLGGRIFRMAILIQGTPPKLKNIIRWAFKG